MLILLVAIVSLDAAGPKELTQITNPQGLYVSDDMYYVTEGTTIHMYSLKNHSYIGKFGKDGEGPGEIRKNPMGASIMLVPHKGKIYVTSMDKLSVFNKTGEFIEEHNLATSGTFFPFAEQFICMGSHQTNAGKQVLALFMAGKNLNRGQLLYASDFEVGQNLRLEFPRMPFYPVTTDDQIIIITGKDSLAIDAFDQTGKHQYRIEKKEPPIPVPASYRVETEKAFKQNPSYASIWNRLKEIITYKSTYPPVYGYFVDDGRIYLLTYKMKGDDRECIVLDLKGKEIKRMTLPIPQKFGVELHRLYTTKHSIFYQLKENEEDETWELHTFSLK
jgi:outer membrane protein assembly factor BamB